jgi:hypothetical protein
MAPSKAGRVREPQREDPLELFVAIVSVRRLRGDAPAFPVDRTLRLPAFQELQPPREL